MHSSDSENSDGSSDLYKGLNKNRNSKEIYNDNDASLSDFEQRIKNIDEGLLNNIIKYYDVLRNKNSENSSNTSSKTTGKFNPNNNMPSQKENSIINKVEPLFDAHDFNETNNPDFKDDYLNSILIQDKDENNRENTSKEKLNNNISLNTNLSTYFEDKKEEEKKDKKEEKKKENKMEIEEDIPNEDSERKGSKTRKKDKFKENGKNVNIKYRKNKINNSKKNPRGKKDEKDEEDEN